MNKYQYPKERKVFWTRKNGKRVLVKRATQEQLDRNLVYEYDIQDWENYKKENRRT